MLQIDLKVDEYVYDMMKGNPKLDFETVGDVETFQYRDKYKIKWVPLQILYYALFKERNKGGGTPYNPN